MIITLKAKVQKSIQNITNGMDKFMGAGPIANVFSNMAILTGGNIAARVIEVLTIPIISRIYTPKDFGVLAVYASTLSLLDPLATFRYSMTIPLPRNNRTAINLVFLCLAIQVLLALVTGAILLFAGKMIFSLLSMQQLVPYWWLLPLGILCLGTYETFTYWATRIKAFGPIAKTKVSQSFFSAAIKIGMGIGGIKPFGLLLGHLASQVCGVFLLVRKFKETPFTFKETVTLQKIVFFAKRYKKFPIYQIPSRFLLSLAVQMPIFYFSAIFGADVAGLFGMAVSVIAVPMQLFGTTLAQAYYAEIAQMSKRNIREIRKLSIGLIKRLFLVSIPFFLLLVFFAPKLFAFVLGERWTIAGQYAGYLSFYLLTQFISSPFVHTLTVLEKQSLFFWINSTRVVLVLVTFFVCKYLSFSPLQTVKSYSLILSSHYVFTLFIILRTLSERIRIS